MKHIHTFESFLNEGMSPAAKSLDDSYTAYAKSVSKSKTESITAYGWLKELPRSTKISDIEEVLNIYFKNHQSIIKSVTDKAKDDGFLNEGAISNLYVLADQAKNLEDFIKAALKEYDMLKDDRATREFLKEIYDEK